MKTTFRSLLEKHEKFIGSYITFPADTAIEVMKQAGVDFVILDLEHEQLTMTEVMSMIRTCDACGMAAMVRVPGLDETSIRKALDMGASAIKVPGLPMQQKQNWLLPCASIRRKGCGEPVLLPVIMGTAWTGLAAMPKPTGK